MKSTCIAIAMALVLSSTALAHGGGLNSSGCHNQYATNSYHCHRGSGGARGSTESPDDDEDFLKWYGLFIGFLLSMHLLSHDGLWNIDAEQFQTPHESEKMQWKFNTTPESAGVEFSIPFDIK